MKTVAFAIVGLTMAAPLAAQDEASPVDAQSEAMPDEQDDDRIVVDGKRDEKDKVVCKAERVVGSRIPQKVCRTGRAAQADEEQAQRDMREGLDRQLGREMVDINKPF